MKQAMQKFLGMFLFPCFIIFNKSKFDGGGKVGIEKVEVQSLILGILALITLVILILILLGVLR